MEDMLRLGKYDVAAAPIDRKEFRELRGQGRVVDADLFQRGRPRTQPVGGHPIAKLRERRIVAGERTPERFARADSDVAAIVDHRAGKKQLARTAAQGCE